MTDERDSSAMATSTETDLVAAIRRVFQASTQPLTLSKIRAHLPTAFRHSSLDDLATLLRRQEAAGIVPFPKYRSQQDRFWDRPMEMHVAQLIQETLTDEPLTLSELRRKLPDYAKTLVEAVLADAVKNGEVHPHPVLGGRGGPRYGISPPDPKSFLRAELAALFRRLEELGFSHAQLRNGALELLHEEEWASPSASVPRRDPPHETTARAPHDVGTQTLADPRAED